MKYISKMDYGTTIGYFVRVPRFIDGIPQPYNDKPEQKFFPKSRHGGWRQALKAAKQWRDDYFSQYGLAVNEFTRNRKPFIEHSLRNTSGVIGIALCEHIKGENLYYGYKAYYSKNKKQHCKEYSCEYHGTCEAFRMACEFRYEHCGTLKVPYPDYMPCKPSVEYVIV